MNRRDFMKTAAAVAMGKMLGVFDRFGSGQKAGAAEVADAANRVIAVRGNDPVAMFRKGIAELDGIPAFVKAGQKVVVKPNIGWNRSPEYGANTNPALVGEIVRQAIAAGASEVKVLDHTCGGQAWKSCYKNSGIEDAVVSAGGVMINADDEEFFLSRELPQAKVLKRAKIHRDVLACDVLINVPVLKNHGGALMTAAVKNYMGMVYDRGFMHGHNLHQTIAELPFYRKADLNIIDAFRVMTTHGPRGNNVNDVKLMGYQILSRDMVAADALATKLLNYDLNKVQYLGIAEAMGLGTAHPAENLITRVSA